MEPPIHRGCLHSCRYCWARRYAQRLAHFGLEPYRSRGFQPSLAKERLGRAFRKDDFIFVSDMGDLWGEWVTHDWIGAVLERVERSEAAFLFLTKNPGRYREFAQGLENAVLGATIESNVHYSLSRAPSVRERYEAMKGLGYPYKAVVIEPILEFDGDFVSWLREIKPLWVAVGYDNYGNRLPEPPLGKTQELIEALKDFTEVRVKTLRKAWWEK